MNVDFLWDVGMLVCEIKGKIPVKLENTLIFLKIKEVFSVIVAKSLDFDSFEAVNRKFSLYIASKVL